METCAPASVCVVKGIPVRSERRCGRRHDRNEGKRESDLLVFGKPSLFCTANARASVGQLPAKWSLRLVRVARVSLEEARASSVRDNAKTCIRVAA
eukprot:4326887-Pleurochrysis_carterae.AAC.1